MMKIVNKVIVSILMLIIGLQTLNAQSEIFKQNTIYPYGCIPSTTSAERTYKEILHKLVVKCDEDYRVIVADESETYVEGMGFVMLLAAYYGDKEIFDGLYRFYIKKRSNVANNMMAWRVTCDSVIDQGSATDGDVDVAFSLIVANEQWGVDYLEKAIEIIDIIKNNVLIDCDGISILAPGYSKKAGETGDGLWGGCELLDIMYHTPAFFRVFADVTGDGVWDKLADDTYTVLNAASHPDTGLVPDWQSINGKPGGNSDWRCNYYRYDACRVPWRIALDYLWNGNSQAKAWCDKVSLWLDGVGAENIVDGYNLDGTPHETASYHNSAFVGGFAVATMCYSQELVDLFGKEMEESQLKEDMYWFNLSTRGLYMFTLTGKFWKPEIE
jgi:endoglucanase